MIRHRDAALRQPRTTGTPHDERGTETVAALAVVAAAVVVLAPLAALIGVAAFTATRRLHRPRRALALFAVASSFVLLAVGPGSVLASYAAPYREVLGALRAGGPLVALAQTRGTAWLRALTPLSLGAGPAVALAADAWIRLHAPSWRSTRARTLSVWERRARRRRVAELRAGRLLSAGVALGVGEGGDVVVVSDHEWGHHALVVGATGSGKTTTLLRVAADTLPRAPLVMLDLKADPALAATLSVLAEGAGRPLVTFRLDGPSHYDVLGRGDASEATNKLIGFEDWSEPHYRRAAERYLQTLLSVFPLLEDRRPSLGEVVELCDPVQLAARLRGDKGGLDPAQVERLRAYLDGLPRDQRSAVAGLGSRLGVLAESSAGPYLSPSATGETLDLLEALDRGAAVLFSLDAPRYPGLAAQVGSLVVQDLLTVAAELLSRGGQRRVTVIIDEFSALDGTGMLGLLARARSAGVAVVLATQDLADLSRPDPAFCDQVLANTAVKIIHRCDVPETTERLAGLCGTTRQWEETMQVESRRPRLGLERGAATGLGSLRRVDEYIVHPNRMRGLRCGEAVVLRKVPTLAVDVVSVVPPVVCGPSPPGGGRPPPPPPGAALRALPPPAA